MKEKAYSVFEIDDLQCNYGDSPTVLSIEQLSIPAGQLIFILGISGVGKSTLIETLGLMNKTIKTNEKTSIGFFQSKEETPIELRNYWQEGNEKLSSFRNRYFSFIFQNTNLMPNFTAGENMCISQLLNGMSLEDAKETVLKVMQELNLPEHIFDRKIMELSGGQRQRLAFVRAITSNYKVLFGDEPTGNLDKNTAFRLIRMLKKNLKDRTCIMVSHDIDLALKYADQIILLTYNSEEQYGEALSENTLFKKDDSWTNNKGQKVNNPENFIYNLISDKETI